jgi:hypothetical protein
MNDPLTPDDSRDVFRALGGLLIGLAALMIFIRKGWFFPINPSQWASFPLFLVFAIPAVFLYGSLFTRDRTGELRVWQVVLATFGYVFVPLALLQFVDVIGGTRGAALNVFWIFGFTAALGFYVGSVRGVRVQLLLASIAAIISWSALWDKLLSNGIGQHYGVYRGVLGVLAIALLAGALYLWRENPGGEEIASSTTAPSGDIGLWKASELFTGAGIAAVLACGLGIASFTKLLGPLAPTTVNPIGTSNVWDVLLLLVSLSLVLIGSQIGTRGPVYIGAIGLTLFLLIAGLDLNNSPPHPFRFGVWPWVLLVLGGLSLALSFSRNASLGDQPRRFIANLRGR